MVDRRDKAALPAADADDYNGFPAVLVRLPDMALAHLQELVVDAWRIQAPAALVKQW